MKFVQNVSFTSSYLVFEAVIPVTARFQALIYVSASLVCFLCYVKLVLVRVAVTNRPNVMDEFHPCHP